MGALIIIYPYLFAVFPVLFLYFNNLPRYPIPLSETALPVLIMLMFTFVVVEGCSRLFRNHTKSSLIVSLFIILFFSYGRLETVFMRYPEHITALFLAVIFFSISYLVLTVRNTLTSLSRGVAVVGAILVLMQPLNYFAHRLRTTSAPSATNQPSASGTSGTITVKSDIYYIILDGYARSDVLKDVYSYNNSAFIESLKELGFFVAKKSTTNYPQTIQSLASSLNMTYLDDISRRVGKQYCDRKPLEVMIKQNAVSSYLSARGYTTVAFGSGFQYTELKGSDIYLNPIRSLSEYQNLLVGSTPIPVILEKLQIRSLADTYRNRTLYTFDHLPDYAPRNDQSFIFAHIIAPHPPFVFDENGNPINTSRLARFSDGNEWIQKEQDRKDYLHYYPKQLTFVNGKILDVVQRIMAGSTEPPIIILQSDHGPGLQWNEQDPASTNLRERMSNFVALYLPGTSDTQPYDSISPVNIFRLVFNRYFGASYELLNDKNYFETMDRPYNFTDVTNSVQ